MHLSERQNCPYRFLQYILYQIHFAQSKVVTKILMRKEIDCNVIRLQFIELMKLTGRPHAVHEKQVLVFFVTFVPPVEEVFVGWLLYVFRAISEIKRVDLDRAKLEVFP